MHGEQTARDLTRDQVHEAEGDGPHRVEVLAVRAGSGLVVIVQGGTHHHVGAVALALPRPSLDDPARVSSSASVLCVVGHKEDLLAREAALDLAAAANCPVSLTAGLHLDNASAADIDTMVANTKRALSRVTSRLVRSSGRASRGRA